MHEIVRLIADAQAGRPISPMRFAQLLEEDLLELERNAGVEIHTARLNPNSEALQLHLRASLLVILNLIKISLDPEKALFYFRNYPVDDFSYKTPEKIVSEGSTIDLLLRMEL